MRAHMAYKDEKPEWMDWAVRVLRPWNGEDRTLQQAVAEGLEEAFAAGQRNEPPTVEEPEPPKTFRRSRAAEPEPTPTVLRRTRR